MLNQFLKLLCRVPRPWVMDPEFTIVESARADATGYSFPSGHTQNSVGTFGVLGRCARRTWVRILCGILMILVPFSRMYLRPHPGRRFDCRRDGSGPGVSGQTCGVQQAVLVFPTLLAAMSACALAFVLYVELTPFPGIWIPKIWPRA